MESNKQEPKKNTKGLVVVTGCDTGIGKSLVEILVQRGYSVAASYLEESQLETTSNIFSKKMDIRNPEEVQNFCGYIMEMCSKGNKLQALISNAGVATPIWNKAKKQNISFVDKKYMSSLHSFQDNFIEGGNKGMDQKTAATKIADILETERPKARYIIAKDVLRSKLLLLLPSIILDKAVKKLFKMNYGG